MKPSGIFAIMDLARNVTKQGQERYVPLFVGPPGVGKSEIVQQWCRKQFDVSDEGMPFIDIRAAYYEAPDLKGFPVTKEDTMKRLVQMFATPDFWPQDPNWEGVIFLDEVNRGTTSVTNCFMQLLTDGKLEQYHLPKKAIICACINPENLEYEVNTMDPALRNRFARFNIEYDSKSFIEYLERTKRHPHVINFVKSGAWKFVNPEDVGTNGTYVSPRSLVRLSNVLYGGALDMDVNMQMEVFESNLGRNYAKTFMQFISDDQPVFYADLVDNKKKALKRLERYSDPNNYKNGHISITIEDIVKVGTDIEDDLFCDVLMTLPADQAAGLLRAVAIARKEQEELPNRLCKKYKELEKRFKTVLKKT